MKIPNLLTISRFCLVPIIAVLLYSTNEKGILLSILLFSIAILTDWADGFIARKYNQKSNFGTLFDPLADKFLILTVFFVFADLNIIPLYLALLLLYRELLVTVVRSAASTSKKVVGANWMGKSKFVFQAAIVLYGQAYLYTQVAGQEIMGVTQQNLFYLTVVLVIISLVFSYRFVMSQWKAVK